MFCHLQPKSCASTILSCVGVILRRYSDLAAQQAEGNTADSGKCLKCELNGCMRERKDEGREGKEEGVCSVYVGQKEYRMKSGFQL